MQLIRPVFPSGHTDVSAFFVAPCVLPAAGGSRTPGWRRTRIVSPTSLARGGRFFSRQHSHTASNGGTAQPDTTVSTPPTIHHQNSQGVTA